MLRYQDLQRLELPFPPLAEQHRIVTLLDRAVALRGLRATTDSKMDRLIDALFGDMFGSGLPDKSHGSASQLGALGKVVTGNTPPRGNPTYYGDFIEWIKTDNIDNSHGLIRPSTEKLSEIGAQRGRVVPAGSVLITCIAGSIERIGDSAATDRSVAINQQINAIVPNESVEGAYLAALTRALRTTIQRRATGVMTRIINKSELEKVPAVLPPRELQRRFAEQLVRIRQLEGRQAESCGFLEDLWRALTGRAFQGEL
jgi:type I restriction enzyme S subunit